MLPTTTGGEKQKLNADVSDLETLETFCANTSTPAQNEQ